MVVARGLFVGIGNKNKTPAQCKCRKCGVMAGGGAAHFLAAPRAADEERTARCPRMMQESELCPGASPPADFLPPKGPKGPGLRAIISIAPIGARALRGGVPEFFGPYRGQTRIEVGRRPPGGGVWRRGPKTAARPVRRSLGEVGRSAATRFPRVVQETELRPWYVLL